MRSWRSSECDMCRVATTLFTGLLRFTRNDKCVDCVAVRNDRLWIASRMTRGGRGGKLKQGD